MQATYKTPPPPKREFLLKLTEMEWHELRWFLSLAPQLTPAIHEVVKADGERQRIADLVGKLDTAVNAVSEEPTP